MNAVTFQRIERGEQGHGAVTLASGSLTATLRPRVS
jgi:hypothetical protein